MTYDLVIRNGDIVDGSGLPRYRADLAVEGGLIRRIGRFSERGSREVDAEGLVVTPGFIDGHTHMDAQVMWDPLGTSSCWHGVTSAVMGNCGFTLAPSRENERGLVVRNLERAEDIPPAALAAGIQWEWETFPEYLDCVDRKPKAMNIVAYVGHSALRTWAMGTRAFEEPGTDREIEMMEAALEEALRAGAIGFTTSRSIHHETSDDRPVASRLASWEEVCRLVRVMARAGAGIFELAPEPAWASPDDSIRSEFVARLQGLACTTGIPFMFPLGSAVSPRCYQFIDLLESTAKLGGRIYGQTHSRGVSSLVSFRTRLPFDVLPEWKAMRRLSLGEQRQALEDPETRRRLVEATHGGTYGRSLGPEAGRPDYESLVVLKEAVGPNPTVAEIAAARRMDPAEVMIDCALESNFDQFFMQPIGNQRLEDQLAVLKHPRTLMTLSDSGAHVSQIADAWIQTYLLAYWVRHLEAISLEEAVRMLTLAPATAWGFFNRGHLREGMVADINIFNPTTVAPLLPTVKSDLPGGAARLEERSVGFLATIVAGEIVIDDGEHTGSMPGRVLRGPLAAQRKPNWNPPATQTNVRN